MTVFSTDSDALSAATSTARGFMDRIQAESTGLTAQLAALEGSWSGQASAAFQGAVAAWRGTQQQVEDVMASLNQALGYAAQQYSDIEQANARLFAY